MTDVDTVRLLISDLAAVEADRTFTDSDLLVFLTLEGDSVKLAAAQALDAIASNESLVSRRIKTLDLQTDGPAVAKDLREHAARLRQQVVDDAAALAAGDAEFEFTDNLGTPTTERLAELADAWPY